MVLDPARIGHRSPAQAGAHWLIGAVLTVSAAALATVLAIVFAATMALAMVVVGAALTTWAVAVRLRRGAPARQNQPVILEARKVGHAWVAYGFDQPAS